MPYYSTVMSEYIIIYQSIYGFYAHKYRDEITSVKLTAPNSL